MRLGVRVQKRSLLKVLTEPPAANCFKLKCSTDSRLFSNSWAKSTYFGLNGNIKGAQKPKKEKGMPLNSLVNRALIQLANELWSKLFI